MGLRIMDTVTDTDRWNGVYAVRPDAVLYALTCLRIAHQLLIDTQHHGS
jgi:hypothetical protein